MNLRALVIGAGPAGLSAALQLSSWCDTVDVFEARARAKLRRVGEHVPPAGISALVKLGLGPLVNNARHGESYGVRSAWDAPAFSERDYMFTPAGRGVNLRRDVFDEDLAKHTEAKGVNIHFNTRLTALNAFCTTYDARLRAQSGTQKVYADFIVDASGRQARAIRLLGGTVMRRDQMVGLFGRQEGCTQNETVGQLIIEAVEDGWLYGVSFEDGQVICTFMTDAALVQDQTASPSEIWHDQISQSKTFSKLVDGGHLTETIKVFDAASQCSQDFTADTCIAVGDAATAYDPLSSWGIVKGILDGHDGAAALQNQHTQTGVGIHAHRATQRSNYLDYLAKRAAVYGEQPRWPTAPFWAARRTVSEAV